MPAGYPNNLDGNIGSVGNAIYNYYGALNISGANYRLINKYPLTGYRLLVFTSIEYYKRVYDPGLTDRITDLFSINPDDSYVHDYGAFCDDTDCKERSSRARHVGNDDPRYGRSRPRNAFGRASLG